MSLEFDDTDPAIVYEPQRVWEREGSPNEYNGTTTGTLSNKATAQVSFIGTSISVRGTIPAKGNDETPVSGYIVDGDQSTSKEFVGKQQADVQYNVTFYSIVSLEPGVHTLKIKNESPTGKLYLDSFRVIGSGLVNPSNTITTSPSQTYSSTSVPAASQSANASDNSHNQLHTGAIVGLVVGVVVLLIATVAGFLLIRRQKRRKGKGYLPPIDPVINMDDDDHDRPEVRAFDAEPGLNAGPISQVGSPSAYDYQLAVAGYPPSTGAGNASTYTAVSPSSGQGHETASSRADGSNSSVITKSAGGPHTDQRIVTMDPPPVYQEHVVTSLRGS